MSTWIAYSIAIFSTTAFIVLWFLVVWQTLPIVKAETAADFNNMEYDFEVRRLALWGVTGRTDNGNYSPDAYVTREQMASFLYNLYEYDRVCNRGADNGGAGIEDFAMKSGNLSQFSDANQVSLWAQTAMTKIVGEGIMNGVGGGRLDPKGICTIEQAQIMCKNLLNFMKTKDLEVYAKRSSDTKYVPNIVSGKYTIQSELADNPYVSINAEGKAELSATNVTVFTVNYLRTELDFQTPHVYTIQAPNKKYLGLTSKNAVNGGQLQLISTPYEWTTRRTGPWAQFIFPMSNKDQVVNAPGFKTADGTPIITWYKGASNDDSNGKFLFKSVK